MKVFFHGYIKSPPNYYEFYRKIYHLIEELGYEHTLDIMIKIDPEKFLPLLEKGGRDKRIDLYNSYLKAIKLADIVVLEVSMHSLSSGFLMHEALNFSKPVVGLYHEGHDPYFALSTNDEKLHIVEYNLSNLKDQLKESLEQAKKYIDVRFNFFITPEIIIYLNWISTIKRTSKSTYIRDLILNDLKKNKEYKRMSKLIIKNK